MRGPADGHLLIDGAWDAAAGSRVDVVSPSTGAVLGSYLQADPHDVDRAVAAAQRAQRDWARTSPFSRAAVLHEAAGAIRARHESFARLLAEENGKPLWAEAMGEIEWAANQLDEAAEWAVRLEGSILPSASPTKQVLVRRAPLGVAGIITPWNHPVMIPCEYLGPALAAGNAVVWVPSPSVILCSAELATCFVEAGLPAGLLNMVPGVGSIVGDALAGHPDVDIVCLTGSSATGLAVARRAAGKPQILELGGNGPTIVLEDADLDLAASAIAVGAFTNAGQSCSSTELVLAHATIRSALADRIVAHAEAVVVGDPLAADTTMGPMHLEQGVLSVEDQVAQAVSAGARVLTGGRRAPDMPTTRFFAPTVITDVQAEMPVAQQETFGPVVPLVPFDHQDQALAIAGASGYGLIAAVFGRDLGRATRVAEQVRAGVVNVNDTSDYWELHIPFGGAAQTRSGLGRIGGRWIAETFTETRTLIVDTASS